MRALQAKSVSWLPPARREHAMANIYRQNRFARKIGLPLMRFTVFLVVASVGVSLIAQLLFSMREAGIFDIRNLLQQGEESRRRPRG